MTECIKFVHAHPVVTYLVQPIAIQMVCYWCDASVRAAYLKVDMAGPFAMKPRVTTSTTLVKPVQQIWCCDEVSNELIRSDLRSHRGNLYGPTLKRCSWLVLFALCTLVARQPSGDLLMTIWLELGVLMCFLQGSSTLVPLSCPGMDDCSMKGAR